jgi:class 3 adenylate cyclase
MPNFVYADLLNNSRIFGEYHVMKAETASHHRCVVFFDICGSVQCRQEMGAHAAFVQVERFRYLLEHWVRTHHGLIVKHTGDGMMAVFTTTNEALRCAHDLIMTVEANPDNICELPCKVGIAQGEVNEIKFNHGDERVSGTIPIVDYVGAPADLAARLVNIAKPNQVLIDDSIARGISGAVNPYKAAASVEVNLKGFGAMKVSELYWPGRPAQHIDPTAYAVPVIKIHSIKDVLGKAIGILANTIQDITEAEKPGAEPLPKDYVLTYVDFPAYGSFSHPEKYDEYRALLLRIAEKRKMRIAVLSPRIAETSSKLQFSLDDYTTLLGDKRAAVENYVGTVDPSYDQFVHALLKRDHDLLGELEQRGIKGVEQNTDPRVHIWIRGSSEAVVSFVFITTGRTGQEWNETGFYTSSSDLVTILRDYILTLLERPL